MNFINLLQYVSLKHLRFQKAQLIMAISGICLGVASIISIDIVNRSVLGSFEDSFNHLIGRTALQISSSGEAGFPEQMLERVQKVPGIAYAVPVIEAQARLAQGSNRSIMILGVDILQDKQIRDYSLQDEGVHIPDPLMFLAKADSILITQTLAQEEGIKIDQDLEVETVQGIKTFKVRGLLEPQGPAKVAGGDITIMDLFAAQKAFGKPDRIDRIDVSLLPGENPDTLKARISQVLPKGYTIDTPAGRTRQVELLMQNHKKNLGLISFLTLLVGMYLIYNAVAISVVQRKKEIGILRALGTTKNQIIRLFLGETLVVSALGSFLGVGLGILFAKLAISAVAQSMVDVLYIKTTVKGITVSNLEMIKGVGIGISASLLAALFPAISSVRITPVSAISRAPYLNNGLWTGTKMKLASAVFILLWLSTLIGYRFADTASVIKDASFVFASTLFLLLGVSFSLPFFLRRFVTFSRRLILSRLGVGGRLAGLNLQNNLSRNAVALGAIFFSIHVLVTATTVKKNIQNSMISWMDSTMRADLLVSTNHVGTTSKGTPLPGEMGKEMERLPGVFSAEPFRTGQLMVQNQTVLLKSLDIARCMAHCPLTIAAGHREEMLRLLPNQDYITISESLAARNRLKPGQSLVLPTPHGPVRFGIAAILVDYQNMGVIHMDQSTYQRHWQDSLANLFEVRLKPNAGIASVRQAILERFGKDRRLVILSAKEFKAEILKILDNLFVFSNAIAFMTLIIGALGIIITLLASVMERRREIGILRALGMTKRQISGIVLIESTLIGLAGGLLGSAVGLIIGWMNMDGIFRSILGTSLTYDIFYAPLILALLLAMGLSALAGLFPARRAAKTHIVEALSYE